jgi:uncharacterized protein YkwD
MPSRLRALAAVLLVALFAVAANASAAPAHRTPVTAHAASKHCAGANAMPSPANGPALRTTVLCLINGQRRNAGLRPLSSNRRLQTAAQRHSADMVVRRYFSHTNLSGRDFSARIHAAGYSGRTSGENIAWGGGYLATPAQIVNQWMHSPGHRANILNRSYRNSGIGIAIGTPEGGQGATYTNDFGAR